jgi:hypothetical protein
MYSPLNHADYLAVGKRLLIRARATASQSADGGTPEPKLFLWQLALGNLLVA